VYVGSCPRNDYSPEWRVNDDVQFRLKKDRMYLKRPKRGELELNFMMSAKLGADGKPIPVVSFSKKR
jgi:hypothetical protein